MNVEQFIEWLRRSEHARNITHWQHTPARPAQYDEWPDGLDVRLPDVLARRGIHRPYTHQARAIERILAGKNVVVVTPTASGKTLCYNAPVLNTLLREPDARAIYLFPTKALAQDQLTELHDIVTELGSDIKTYTYDGDTPANARTAIRSAGHIVITNPDMLHTGILPHHTRWHRLFSRLKYVVIDEMHQYRGVFGSNVANVIRRLRRVCEHYGSRPQFILCSATIANPGELAARLIADDVAVVDENGAPRGEKHFVFYNPPVVNAQLGIRGSSVLAARRLANDLLANDIQTILFARSRLTVEVLLSYLRDDAARLRKPGSAVRGYRGGYLPQQRREIERGLRDGTVRGVVSTNALELGIDIGQLDACVMVGYPGTVASTWQQAGRAGRRASASLAILVGTSSPLDQFIVQHPEYFFGAPVEHGLVSPQNLYVLVNHVKCAAFELPFGSHASLGSDRVDEILWHLREQRVLHQSGNRWFWAAESFPAEEVSLRTAAAENVVIIDQTETGRPRVIGEMDRPSAMTLLHDEAIYLHEGEQYEVVKLDLEEKKAFVRRVEVDYYTDANLAVRLQVIDTFGEQPSSAQGAPRAPAASKAWGEVSITYLATIFKKIRFETHDNVGWGKIRLPEDNLHTTACWFALDDFCVAELAPAEIQETLLGLAHVLGNIAPLLLMCAPPDIGVHPEVRSPFTGRPTLYIYERIPGGVGMAEKLYQSEQQLFDLARQLVADCGCQAGCPSCVGALTQDGEQTKRLVRGVLERLCPSAGRARDAG